MKPTLQRHLSFLSIFFSILFIGTFSAIQVVHQVNVLGMVSRQKANLGAFITKSALEASLSFEKQADPDQLKEMLRTVLLPLQDAGVIDHAVIFSEAGDVIDSLGEEVDSVLERGYFWKLNELISFEQDQNKAFFSLTDRTGRAIHILILISEEIPIAIKLKYSLGTIREAVSQIQAPLLAVTASVILINLIFAFLISRRLIRPIKILNKASKDVGTGDFNARVNIQTDDELEELGCTFNLMAHELRKFQLQAENVNPLTKLPGNILIQEEVEKRIRKEEKFVVIYADLNNFKTFNDKYGFHHGDLVIHMTAEVIQEALKKRGASEDFVGHEGGDDFVIVTVPERAHTTAETIIQLFDERVKTFFSKADNEHGYYTAIGRDGLPHQYPLTGIALAGVTNEFRYLEHYAKVTQICAEVKKGAKAKLTSAWLLDQRSS